MKQSDYTAITNYIHNQSYLSIRSLFNALLWKFDSKFSPEVLLSICLFHYQNYTKQAHRVLITEENISNCFLLYESDVKTCEKSYSCFSRKSGEESKKKSTLISLSEDNAIPASLLARLILKRQLQLQHSVLEDDEDKQALHIKTELLQKMKNPFLILDNILSFEVRQCVLYDIGYGSVTDSIRHMIGLEFEQKLLNHVKALNISFQSEAELRKLGYDKTPDVKFEVPICIKGHVVCWIESKASFGGPEPHKLYLKDQYYSYWNRFGSGLVIYWYGFVDELAEEALNYGILLLDNFPPENVIERFEAKVAEHFTIL